MGALYNLRHANLLLQTQLSTYTTSPPKNIDTTIQVTELLLNQDDYTIVCQERTE